MRGRPGLVLGVVVALAGALAGCGADDGAPGPTASPARVARVPVDVPSPGATVAPDPDATSVEVPADLRLVVVAPEEPEPAAAVLVEAVERWATGAGVEAAVTPVVDHGDLQRVADEASGAVVVVPGEALVDDLDGVSAQNLHVDFLVLGAQLPEPTENVTAVVWSGATSRGSRVPADDGQASEAVTPERADDAVGAGFASVLAGRTGVVVHLDAARER